jgi:hypothetical protein
MAGKIKITQKGPSGTVQYSEGWLKKNTCEFHWEFGGGDTVAIVWVPAEGKWDAKYPWASGRRKEIITFVAEDVRRMQAPSSAIKWDADSFSLVKA